MAVGTLYSLCGKMGAGKSTYAGIVASEHNAVVISEDDWLSQLFPGQINNFDDYRRYSSRLKPLLREHVKKLLQAGTNVVMDFPANTVGQRKWLRELGGSSANDNILIYIKASDPTCLKQIAIRRQEQPERARFDTEAVFDQVTAYFQEPAEGEGFIIEVIEKELHK